MTDSYVSSGTSPPADNADSDSNTAPVEQTSAGGIFMPPRTSGVPLDTLAKTILARLTKAEALQSESNKAAAPFRRKVYEAEAAVREATAPFKAKIADHYIAAGLNLAEARDRVAVGEAGDGVTWKGWLKDRGIGEERARICLKIAKDPDPSGALAAHREQQAARQATHRANDATNARDIPDVTGDQTDTTTIAEPEPSWLDRFTALWNEGTDNDRDTALVQLAIDHAMALRGLLDVGATPVIEQAPEPPLKPAKRRAATETTPDPWLAESQARRAAAAPTEMGAQL